MLCAAPEADDNHDANDDNNDNDDDNDWGVIRCCALPQRHGCGEILRSRRGVLRAHWGGAPPCSLLQTERKSGPIARRGVMMLKSLMLVYGSFYVVPL